MDSFTDSHGNYIGPVPEHWHTVDCSGPLSDDASATLVRLACIVNLWTNAHLYSTLELLKPTNRPEIRAYH